MCTCVYFLNSKKILACYLQNFFSTCAYHIFSSWLLDFVIVSGHLARRYFLCKFFDSYQLHLYITSSSFSVLLLLFSQYCLSWTETSGRYFSLYLIGIPFCFMNVDVMIFGTYIFIITSYLLWVSTMGPFAFTFNNF